MKWKYKDWEVEGTMEEFREFQKSFGIEEKPEKEKVEKTVVFVHGRGWTNDEDAIVLNASSINAAKKQLPGRTRAAVIARRTTLKKLGKVFQNLRGKGGKKYKYKQKSEVNRQRLIFLNKRAAYYMKQYNWSREKAWVQASADWKTHSGLGDITPKELVEVEVYALIRWMPTEGKTDIVGVYTTYDEAQKRLDEYKNVEVGKDNPYQYAILKKTKIKGD